MTALFIRLKDSILTLASWVTLQLLSPYMSKILADIAGIVSLAAAALGAINLIFCIIEKVKKIKSAPKKAQKIGFAASAPDSVPEPETPKRA